MLQTIFQSNQYIKLLKFIFKQYLSKSIDYLLFNRNIFKSNNINNNLFLYIVILNINIFNIYIKLKIFNKSYIILIIVIDNNSLYILSAKIKLIKKFIQLNYLLNNLYLINIFNLI